MNRLTRDQVVGRLKQLPSLPTAVSSLLASFDQDDLDVAHVAAQIARDQSLTARVLRVANSSFYGLQCKVGTINEAVVVLGFRALRSMVLAVGMSGAFRAEQCPGFNVAAYLRHCVATGLAARELAPLTGHNQELAFTAGILHDIGELVLASSFSAQYAAALAYKQAHDCFTLVAESEVLGLNHADIGSLLAETWHFPEELREAVALHHAPVNIRPGSLAEVIHVADGIAHALGVADVEHEIVMPLDGPLWRRLGLNEPKVSGVLPQIVAGMDETCAALSA